MTIEQTQNEIIEDFSMFDEWMDKYEYIIELGKELPQIKEEFKTEENKITGCQSQVWLHAEYNDGIINFTADSDAIITKGVIALLIKVLNKRTPKEIRETDLYFLEKIGLQANLSPTRANGLASMVKQLKFYAIAFSQK